MGHGKGDRRSIRRGTSIEFVDYRHYTPGDDPRQVDWNIFGRSGSLFVKMFEEEEVLTAHVLVDGSASMDWGTPNKASYGRQLAAALGYIGLSGSSRVMGGVLTGDSVNTFGPAWGRRHTASLVQFLDSARFRGSTDLNNSLRSYLQRSGDPGVTFLISDLLPPSFEIGLRALLDRRYEVVVLHLLSPQELRPPMTGDLNLIDRETGEEIPITLNQEALDRYLKRLEEWSRETERMCIHLGAVYERISSADRLEHVLFDRLRRRGALR
ncbi:MAG: hypothetical protein QOE19_1669 [Actinomycetota bacterium]|nr:hypothetical protein [Actinomycetota bacterium]